MDDPEPVLNIIFLSVLQPITSGIIVSFVILLILLLFSALISGSEVAFFSLTPSDLEKLNESEQKSHKSILSLLRKPKRLLATILISNNFINVGIVILSTYIVHNLFNFNGIKEWVVIFFEVGVITFILLLIGEILPKIYATKQGLKLATIMVYPISFLGSVFKPLSSMLIYSTNLIDRRIKKKGHDISVDELSHALELTEDIDESEDEHKILRGIIKFGEISVKQIMKARVDVLAIDKTKPYNEVMETILDNGFSRLPVYEDSFDKIIGVLYVKDVLGYIQEENDFEWLKLIREPFFVPENKKLDDLLKEFQTKKVHLAVVVDEYGGTSGIVTLEDVLEEIVGEISDEFDDEDMIYSKLDENNYVFEGKTSLNDMCRILDIDDDHVFEEVRKDADSLAGLVIEIAGKIPKKNEKIKYKNFTFVVEAADKRRVKRIKVTKNSFEESHNES